MMFVNGCNFGESPAFLRLRPGYNDSSNRRIVLERSMGWKLLNATT